MVRVCLPFMDLWVEIEGYTGGDGYLDKLCMELVGLPSSRNRPPTRDVRERYRDRTRQMLLDCGVPNVVGSVDDARVGAGNRLSGASGSSIEGDMNVPIP